MSQCNTAGTVFRESVFPLPPTPPRMMPGISAAVAHPGPGGLRDQTPPTFSFSEGLVPTSPRRNHLKSLVWILFSGLCQAEGRRPQHKTGAGGNFLPLCHGGYQGDCQCEQSPQVPISGLA